MLPLRVEEWESPPTFNDYTFAAARVDRFVKKSLVHPIKRRPPAAMTAAVSIRKYLDEMRKTNATLKEISGLLEGTASTERMLERKVSLSAALVELSETLTALEENIRSEVLSVADASSKDGERRPDSSLDVALLEAATLFSP